MENLANVLVAASNAPALWAVARARHTSAPLYAAVAFVAVASFVSHLFESHKHGMRGFGTPPALSYALNRADVAGCVAVVLVFAYEIMVTRRVPWPSAALWARLALALLDCAVSEYHAHDASLKWRLYVPGHMLWHALAFGVLRDALPQ
jgi:hypothetical protein